MVLRRFAVDAVFVVSNGLTRWAGLSTRKIDKDQTGFLPPALYSRASVRGHTPRAHQHLCRLQPNCPPKRSAHPPNSGPCVVENGHSHVIVANLIFFVPRSIDVPAIPFQSRHPEFMHNAPHQGPCRSLYIEKLAPRRKAPSVRHSGRSAILPIRWGSDVPIRCRPLGGSGRCQILPLAGPPRGLSSRPLPSGWYRMGPGAVSAVAPSEASSRGHPGTPGPTTQKT